MDKPANLLKPAKDSRLRRPPGDVEQLIIWTYRAQKADVMAARATPRLDHGITGTFIVCNNMELQARVDSGGPITAFDVHPEAERVHELVLTLDALSRGLVIHFGRTGATPDWMEGKNAAMGPVLTQRNRPAMLIDGDGAVVGCRVQVLVWQEQIDLARRTYEQWWDCMDALAQTLKVNGPACARQPWRLNPI